MSPVNTSLTIVKKCFSLCLLAFCIVIVSALVLDGRSSLSKNNVPPALVFCLMWCSLIWLSMVEGSQASLASLPPVDRRLYKETHPITYQICEYAHYGENLDRYLMGRQFMVLALVFVIHVCGTPTAADATVLDLPKFMTDIFLNSGFATILVTCMIGQLNTQVNACHCMLDYLNTHFATVTVNVAMAIEASGILHASYLVQFLVTWMVGKPIESEEPPRSFFQSLLFWGRVLFSVTCLALAFFVTLQALVEGKTTMWEGIPTPLTVIIFFALLLIIGVLEGMQIAFFAASKMTQHDRDNTNAWARSTCELLFRDSGKGLPGFMIGRQLCVVTCFFLVARATSIRPGGDHVLGVGDGVELVFETGLLGALITTVVASITWQLIASAFPLIFLGNPFTYMVLRICLFLEATGVASGSWVLAMIHKKIAGFEEDELYLGCSDERNDMGHCDRIVRKCEVGHLTGGAFPANQALPSEREIMAAELKSRRQKILANIRDLRDQMWENTATESEAFIFEESIAMEVCQLEMVDHELQQQHVEFQLDNNETFYDPLGSASVV